MSGSDLCIPRNETARPRYFQNRIIMFSLPISSHVSVSALHIQYIHRIGQPILLQPNKQEAAQFHFLECINRIRIFRYSVGLEELHIFLWRL